MTRIVRSLSLTVLGAWISSCSEAPQRVTPGASAASAADAAPVRFAGSVTLEGAIAEATSGSLFVIVRQLGARMPSLARKYEVGDPAFLAQGDARVLHFALDQRDDMGGAAAPITGEMEVEARFDPDGFVDTNDGVVRNAVRAKSGDTEISIVLRPESAGEGAPAGEVAGSQKGS